jgi:hypothetical protein
VFDRISIGVRDLACARQFYDTRSARSVTPALARARAHSAIGRDKIALCIGQAARPVPPEPGSNLHFRFAAPTREAVDAFHAAAPGAGCADNGAPGLRPDYGAGYYATF